MFQEAEEELKILGKSNYEFYQKAKPILEFKIRENKYFKLEEDRLRALEWENFGEVYEMTTKTLRHQMRKAARNKDYDYFEFFPNIWAFKDEFKMTPIDYMALEGDVIGLGKTYESSGNLIMDENVFSHNILDLLGLSCDPRFGDNGEALIDLLKEITYLIEGDIIYNRIEFLKTGLGDEILSYNISKDFLDRIDYKERKRLMDVRMEELNSRLISSNHFKELKFNLMDLETAEGFL